MATNRFGFPAPLCHPYGVGRLVPGCWCQPGRYVATPGVSFSNRDGQVEFATILRMVLHTFAFRWKAGVTEEQKLRAQREIRVLQGQIPGLLETHVGFNFSPRGQGYEFGGVMKFTDRAALEAYGPSPVHQKLLEWLVPLIEPIEVDFEV